MNVFGVLGAASAFLGVALGAFGAHALRARLSSEALAVFETGVRYQMFHALALLVVAARLPEWGSPCAGRVSTEEFPLPSTGRVSVTAGLAGWLFVAGTILFSGSLYALALTGIRGLGAITPLGGLCFLAGWVLLALAFARP